MSDFRKNLVESRRWVVKIGSSLLTNDGKGLDREAISRWSAQCNELRKQGIEVVLVSSGAVAEGMVRLSMQDRPDKLSQLQAVAAVGQMGLVQAWEQSFLAHGVATAQVLLTHDDMASRTRYLNARNTLGTLLHLGVVPVVNENDTISVSEISLGDNDTLGALVANLIDAGALVILTDQDGLFDQDPRNNPNAKLIPSANANDPAILKTAGGGGVFGRGGMRTKITAARKAGHSGCVTAICNGREPDLLQRLASGEVIGTILGSERKPLPAKKQWIASHTQIAGIVVIDEGAAQALKKGGVSLLPVGVVRSVTSEFGVGELVECITERGESVARGLVNFSSRDIDKIAGLTGSEVLSVLNGVQYDEVIHYDNLILL